MVGGKRCFALQLCSKLHLEARNRAARSVWSRVHVGRLCRCSFRNTGKLAGASAVGTWISAPLRKFRLRFEQWIGRKRADGERCCFRVHGPSFHRGRKLETSARQVVRVGSRRRRRREEFRRHELTLTIASRHLPINKADGVIVAPVPSRKRAAGALRRSRHAADPHPSGIAAVHAALPRRFVA